MLKANYHTHLVYCGHAEGHAEDYIKKAIELGFDELGISDHAPVLECVLEKDDYIKNWVFQFMKLDTMYEKYLPEIESAKEKYKDKIKVYTALETEYLKRNEFFLKILRSKVDYLNLGVHYFEYNGFIYNTYSDLNYETIYGYMNACIEGMKSNFFNTLVHPDLFIYHYKNEKGLREFDKHCEYVSRKIIEAAIENNVYLEINAGGIRKHNTIHDPYAWNYPYIDFWKIVKEYPQVKILIGADAHSPKALNGNGVFLVSEFAKELGLKVLDHMEVNH